jgi:hypothetical protein
VRCPLKLNPKLKNFLYPLLGSKIIIKKYSGGIFKNISDSQISTIVKRIIKEVEYSRTFNFYLRPKDVEKEILIWLTLINYKGGVDCLLKDKDYEACFHEIAFMINDLFAVEHKFYRRRIKYTKETFCENAFGDHLESVESNLLLSIKNDLIK